MMFDCSVHLATVAAKCDRNGYDIITADEPRIDSCKRVNKSCTSYEKI